MGRRALVTGILAGIGGLGVMLLLQGAGGDAIRSRALLAEAVDETLAGGWGLELGVAVQVEGQDILFERSAHLARPAASAIKTFIALDLLRELPDQLDRVPPGLDLLLAPGVHPAFSGFGELELRRSRRALSGATYRELAGIMMGSQAAPNDVYNAACNVIMIKLGGPRAIETRVHDLHPGFASLDLNRYMLQWRGDGDNRVSPLALLTLYRLIAEGDVPGLDPEGLALLREWLRPGTPDAPPDLRGKAGTLYPAPMTRVQSGYLERGDRDLVFAIMGEMRPVDGVKPADAFVVLLASVDSLASLCRSLP